MIENAIEEYDLGKWLEIGLLVGVILWVLYLLPMALSWDRLADQLFPLLSIALVLLLASIQILRNVSETVDAIFTPEETDGFSQEDFGQSGEETPVQEDGRTIFTLMGWVVLFPIMVYYLGFGLATPVYTFAIFWYYHRDLKHTVILSLILLVGMYVLFIWFLGIQVGDGVLNVPDPLDYI